jgi:hypothetical protein
MKATVLRPSLEAATDAIENNVIHQQGEPKSPKHYNCQRSIVKHWRAEDPEE